MVKIAVASSDGKLVNQHFGKADTFYIADVDEENLTYLFSAIKKVSPICYMGDHDKDKIQENIEELTDCDIVLVSKIGTRARYELERNNIEVYEIPGIIDESLDKLLRYKKVQALLG